MVKPATPTIQLSDQVRSNFVMMKYWETAFCFIHQSAKQKPTFLGTKFPTHSDQECRQHWPTSSNPIKTNWETWRSTHVWWCSCGTHSQWSRPTMSCNYFMGGRGEMRKSIKSKDTTTSMMNSTKLTDSPKSSLRQWWPPLAQPPQYWPQHCCPPRRSKRRSWAGHPQQFEH